MSWPSIWQTQNQSQSQGAQAPAANMNMYQLTAEQQYALQQQNWQQWQLYQTQLAQWQAQYGEQYQKMQTDMMAAQSGLQNMVQNAFMQSSVPPLPPIDQPPPPPPAPSQQTAPQDSTQTTAATQSSQQNPSTSYEHNLNEQRRNPYQQQQQQPPLQQNLQQQSRPQQYMLHQQQQSSQQQQLNQRQQSSPNSMTTNQNESSHMAQASRKGTNYEQSNYSGYSQQNQDGAFRRNNNNANSSNNSRNNRWNNNRNNRAFGGNNFNNRNPFERDEPMFQNDAQQNTDSREEKSEEEKAFDIQFRKWEDSFMEWKRNNANHPDQNQYNDFVVKMEGCRKQLLQRREMLKQKRLDAQREAQNSQSLNADDQMDSYEDKPEQGLETNRLVEEQQNQEPEIEATGDSAQGSSSTSFFGKQPGDSAGIPGLDLVSDKKSPMLEPKSEPKPEPKPEPNIVEHVNNILGNPEIQSLLSNIQKQQHVSEPPKIDDIKKKEDFQLGSDTFNRFGNASHFDRPQNDDIPQRNSFRSDNRDDSNMQQYHDNPHEDGNNRGRFWNENTSNDFNRDRNNYPHQQQYNRNFDSNRFEHNQKRPRESLDTFNAPNKKFHDDRDEFRPMHVIDYQNRSQHQPSPFNQPLFPGINVPNTSHDFDFPRKVIEYDHKSKTHSWNWFCPIVQIEYNHGKTGFSLHEHPPPKRVEECRNEQPHRFKQQTKDDLKQLRQPKWAQNERQERFAHEAQGQHGHYQPRYDNRQNTQQPEPHFRRNQPEKSWVRNNRGGDWNSPHTYDRFAEPRNVPQRSDNTLPNTSSFSSYHATESAVKADPPMRCDLKDLLLHPGRNTRPKKIVILMRGVPGSGKSYISKMIKDKETEMGGSARILSIDDYFMTENETSSYEFDAEMEETYTQYLLKSFKKTLMDNLYDCVIVDCKNTSLMYLSEFHMIAKAHYFAPFICELPRDLQKCLKNNIHNRSESDIKRAINEWVATPSTYTVLDYECLFNSADDTEEISDIEDEKAESLDAISDEDNSHGAGAHSSNEFEDEPTNEFGFFKSKWDNDTTENKLARLDGINKPMKHTTIEDYLQMDGWEPPPTSTNGKKRVRWADIEEKREQDKQRAIGFVVGQTNWNNLIDRPRDHSQALTKVKYIEKVRRN